MARKSSFLQGFEVGSDLYNKGFSQAQSLAQMKLQADAQAERKKRLEMEIEEFAKARKQSQIKAQNLEKGMNAVKAANDFMQFFDPLKNTDDYKTWNNDIVPSLFAAANSTEQTSKQFQGMMDLVESGKVALDTVSARGRLNAGKESDRLANHERQKALATKRSSWKEFGLHATKESHEDDFKIASQVKTIGSNLATGVYEDGLDNPEVKKLVSEFPGDSDLLKNYLTVEFNKRRSQLTAIDDAGLKAQNAAKAQADITAGKVRLNNKTDFNEYANKVGKPQWDFDNPEHRAEAVTHQQYGTLIKNFKEGGYKGIALLKSLKPLPNGGFDQDDIAVAYGELTELEAEIKKSGEGVKLTEVQAKSVMYGVAMYQAQLELSALANEGYQALSLRDRAAISAADWVPGSFFGVSEQGQRYLTAMANWNNAKLRKDSGAAITVAEVDNYTKSLFPRLGEKGAGIQAKQKARDAAYFALKKGAGPGLESFWVDLEEGLKIPSTVSPSQPKTQTTVRGASARRPGTAPMPQGQTGQEAVATFGGSREENEKKFNELFEQGKIKVGDKIKILGADGVFKTIPVGPRGGMSQTPTPRLPDSPSGSIPDVQVDPGYSSRPAQVESPQLQESPRSRFSTEQVEQIKSVLGQFRNKGEALAEVLGDETLRGKAMQELGKRFGDKIPSIDDLKELLPELEEAPTPEDNQFEEDAREATRWAPHASSEAVMDESQDKPAIPPLPRGNHDEWRAQLRTMAEKKGGATNAAKMYRPFVGLNITGGSIKGVITAQDDPGVWIGKPGPEQRFLPWSVVIKLIDKDQIQPGNSAPEEHEGPDAIDEVIKSLGSKKDALMKVLGDEELRKKALEELRKRLKK